MLVLGCAPLLAAATAAGAGPATTAHFLPAEAVQRCSEALAGAPTAALRARARSALGQLGVRQPAQWADAVLAALCASQLPVDAEHVALVFALIETESGFNPHGLLPNPPEGFRKLGYRLIHDLLSGETSELENQVGKELAPRVLRAATTTLHTLGLLSEAPLRALFDRTYQRFDWQRVSTERDIETTVTRDLLTLAEETSPLGLLLRAALAVAPDWRRRLAEGTVLRSLGPLQVEPKTAVRQATADGWALDERQARDLLYTIPAGVYYGVRQVKPYIAAVTRSRALTAETSSFIAADRWLGMLACRDAALVRQVAQLAGREAPPATSSLQEPEVRQWLLALQGTLQPPAQRTGAPPAAATSSHAQAVDRLLALARHPGLEHDGLYHAIRAAHQRRFGREPAWGLVPGAHRYSPKNGRFRVSEIASAVRQRFARNCIALGCAPQ